jgi:hypothetical protein
MTHRHVPSTLCAAVLALLLTSVAAAGPVAASTALRGQATLHFGGFPGGSGDNESPGLSNAPCEPDSFCGTGRFDGLGPVMVYLDGDSYGDEVPGHNCVAYEKDEAIVPYDEFGVLVLHSTGTACFLSDGNSAPPGTDFGNPGVYTTTFTIDADASEGVFAGATGGGTETFRSDGDVAQWSFTGSWTPAG